MMAVMLVSSLASAQAKGVSYDDFASNRWSGGWEAVYESSQNVGSGLAQVTATADPDRREPGLVTSYSFYPAHETVYVCWEVLTPPAVIAGAQWSLVSPCDGGGSLAGLAGAHGRGPVGLESPYWRQGARCFRYHRPTSGVAREFHSATGAHGRGTINCH